MTSEFIVLAATAAGIGFIHTIIGPDHYLPFIALSKARGWPGIKTFMVTFLCGIGHILSSVILGFIGIILGIAVFKLEAIESLRADWASWFLISFGFVYFIWGMHKAFCNKPHEHIHIHEDGQPHKHTHTHFEKHVHVHGTETRALTPWVLFIIFVFGPCEPLIPLIMYPAARHNMFAVAIVALVFGIATISTMLGIVFVSSYGLSKLPLRSMERYSHALAGFAIFACGAAIKLFGL